MSQDINNKILLIDGMSVFMQMWHSFSCFDKYGEPANGLGGFLNIIGTFIDDIKPSHVFVIWESGSSDYRNNISVNYKKSRFKRSKHDLTNRTKQISKTIQILKDTPICQVYVNNCESMDTIAYLCNNLYQNKQKVIISTNKHLYQLIDHRTVCYSPVTKLYITEQSILNEFRIFSKNFAVALAMCGEVASNIKGIKGLGFVRLSKLFPAIQCKKINLDQIFETSKNLMLANTLYNKVQMNFETIKNNWKLIQLENIIIDVEQINQINIIIQQHANNLDYQKLMTSLAETQLAINHEKLIESMIFLSENNTTL